MKTLKKHLQNFGYVIVSIIIIYADHGLIFSQKNETKNSVIQSDSMKKLSTIAQSLEIFPVELIAEKGPFVSASEISTYRTDLLPDQFLLFFEFCDIALKITPEEVSASIDKLQSASPKETALILTLLYISVRPRCDPLSLTEYEENFDLIRIKGTWLDMMLLTNSFDLTSNTIVDVGWDISGNDTVKAIIESFKDDRREAFSSYNDNKHSGESYIRQYENYYRSIMSKVDLLGIDRAHGVVNNSMFYAYIPEIYQQEYFVKMSQLCPEMSIKTRAEFAYATYFLRRGKLSKSSSGGPSVRNLSKSPKTVGQVAQQLLKSWPENDNNTTAP